MADYCTDVFKMVEDTDDSFRMWQGLVGPYYVPIMSNDGTLRWTNNGGLPNPSEANLMGPQGAGIRIAGIRESVEELPVTAPAGDIWLVGEGSPYEGYSYTGGEWLDLGPLTVGPAGPPGPQGDDYELTEADKAGIAEISESLLLSELDNDPLEIRYGGTGAHDLAGAKENLGIGDIEDKLGTWPLGTDAQDVAGAINEMIGEISLQVADIQQLKDNFAGEFSPTSTYAVGAYVVYGGAFWRCTTAVTTAGSWTGASNWTQVTAGGEFEAVRGIIGTSPLNTTAQTLTGAINEHETDISDLDTALSGKVSKAGDTMTGNLEIDNTSPGEILKNTAMDVTDSSYASTVNSTGFRLRDKNGKNVVIITDRYFANGSTGLWMTGWKNVNGSNIANSLGLYVDKNGNRVVDVSDSAIWREALNAVSKAGDTMTESLSVKDSRIASGTTPASDVYGNGFFATDKDGAIVGCLRELALASGQQGVMVCARRLVNGGNVENILRVMVNSSGGRVVYVNDPAAWRSALGLGTSGALPITPAQGGTGATSLDTFFIDQQTTITTAPSSADVLMTYSSGTYRISISGSQTVFPGSYGILEVITAADYGMLRFTKANSTETKLYVRTYNTVSRTWYDSDWRVIGT